MFDKNNIDKKVNLAAVFFMMFVAALFVISMSGSASAYPFALAGKVVSIDANSKTLTLQQDQCGLSGQFGITWGDHSTVMRGDDFISFNDIRVGDNVIVTYYEKNPGEYVAEDIDIPASGMLPERC